MSFWFSALRNKQSYNDFRCFPKKFHETNNHAKLKFVMLFYFQLDCVANGRQQLNIWTCSIYRTKKYSLCDFQANSLDSEDNNKRWYWNLVYNCKFNINAHHYWNFHWIWMAKSSFGLNALAIIDYSKLAYRWKRDKTNNHVFVLKRFFIVLNLNVTLRFLGKKLSQTLFISVYLLITPTCLSKSLISSTILVWCAMFVIFFFVTWLVIEQPIHNSMHFLSEQKNVLWWIVWKYEGWLSVCAEMHRYMKLYIYI